MKFTKRQLRLIALSIASTLSMNIGIAYDAKHTEFAYNSHLGSFPVGADPIQEEAAKVNYNEFMPLVKSLFKEDPFTIKELSERQQRERAYAAGQVQPQAGNIINTDFIDRLEVFSGTGEHRTDHIFSRLTSVKQGADVYSLLQTKVGEKFGRDLLAQPITDIKELERRQAIIKALLTDEALLQQCESHLKNFKAHENLFLNLFQKDDLIDKKLIDRLQWQKPWTRFLNGNQWTLELGTRFSNLGTILATTWLPVAIGTGIWTAYSKAQVALRKQIDLLYPHLSAGQKELKFIETWTNGKHGIKTIWNTLSQDNKTMLKIVVAYYSLLLTILYVPSALVGLSNARINKNVANCLQSYLIGMASCVDSMKGIHGTITNNEKLAHYKGSFKALEELTQPSSSHKYEFNLLIDTLDANTFRGEASFFSLTGRVLHAYNLARTEGVMAEFAPALQAFGELDMYVAVAKKMKSQATSSNAPFCFAKYVDKSDKPFIKARGFWNIFVDPAKAVPNTLILGKESAQYVILTGPNTGGKSTIMKAKMINLLLAQTLGVACAEEFSFTPFANLDTYINITDYTGGEVSGLKAEVLRAKQLVERIRALPRNQFAFVILDEIFKATSPDQAEKLAYKFLKEIGEFDNCMFIDATHFKNLVELEKEDPRYANYHMGAIVNAQGRVVQYTYKLEPGPSTVQNAAQVAQDSDLW